MAVAGTLLQCRCPREEPMVDSEDPTGHALELARSATPAMARRRTALAAVARPAAEVAGLLVEVMGSPRARAAALGLARSLAGWLAGRRPPAAAGPQTMSNARAARGNSGSERPARWPRPADCHTSGDRRDSSPKQRFGVVAGRASSPPSTRGLDRSGTAGAHASRTWTAWSARVAGTVARLQMHYRAGQGARDPVDGLDP